MPSKLNGNFLNDTKRKKRQTFLTIGKEFKQDEHQFVS